MCTYAISTKIFRAGLYVYSMIPKARLVDLRDFFSDLGSEGGGGGGGEQKKRGKKAFIFRAFFFFFF